MTDSTLNAMTRLGGQYMAGPTQPTDDLFTCPDCGHTAPKAGLISFHEPDCVNVDEYDDDAQDDWDDGEE